MTMNRLGAAFTADGVDYTLVYDFNKLCDMEDVGIDLLNGKIDATALKSPSYVRQLIFDGCQTADGKGLESLADAGRIVTQIGFSVAVQKIAEALLVPYLPGDEVANPKTAQSQH